MIDKAIAYGKEVLAASIAWAQAHPNTTKLILLAAACFVCGILFRSCI